MSSNSSSSSSSSGPSVTTTVVYTIAAVTLARWTWQSTPDWIKNNIPGIRNGDDAEEKDDSNNATVATPMAVYTKVCEVMTLARELSDDVTRDDMPNYTLFSCFMSMIRLMNQIDENHPEWRESYFQKDGKDVEEAELRVLTKYLDLADWAYLESHIELDKLLQPNGYKLVRFDNATEPGRVGHFIAVKHEEKQVVIAIKGTSTFADVLTDILGKAIPHTLEGDKEIRCHEGMYTAAQYLLEETMHLIENFFFPQAYKLVVCGHSLGAGVSCLLGMFIKQHLPKLNLQVYAFATPACCSYDASLSCQDYITSIVNNNDCVPRLSLMNLRTLNTLMCLMEEKLEKKGLNPDSFANAQRFFSDLMAIDAEMLMSADELGAFLENEFEQQRNDDTDRFIDLELYVPGRVVSIWNQVKDTNIVCGRVTNGQTPVLKQIFIESNMVSDHLCDAYRDNLNKLLDQLENTI